MPRKKRTTTALTSSELLGKLGIGESGYPPPKEKKYTVAELVEKNEDLIAENDLLKSENQYLKTIIARLQKRIDLLEEKWGD